MSDEGSPFCGYCGERCNNCHPQEEKVVSVPLRMHWVYTLRTRDGAERRLEVRAPIPQKHRPQPMITMPLMSRMDTVFFNGDQPRDLTVSTRDYRLVDFNRYELTATYEEV